MIVVKNLNIFEYVSLNSNVKLSMWIVILFLHAKIEIGSKKLFTSRWNLGNFFFTLPNQVRIVNWKTFSFYFNLNQSTNKSFVRRHGLKHSGGRRCKKPTDLSKEYLQDTVLELVMLLISQLAVFASLHLSKNNCWWWTFKQKRETIPKKNALRSDNNYRITTRHSTALFCI